MKAAGRLVSVAKTKIAGHFSFIILDHFWSKLPEISLAVDSTATRTAIQY
jgi:hypothetical protein